jgi:UDP-N-acetylmuramoyl-tripeptide--D-alanyl-D-alanine ligase
MFGWRKVFAQARKRVKNNDDVEVIVQEIGADKPGDIAAFGQYLHPDIAIIAAVTPEHMAAFGALDAVAAEELTAANFSKLAIINREDIDGEHFAKFLTNPNIFTYGDTDTAEYSFTEGDYSPEKGYNGYFTTPNSDKIEVPAIHVLGLHSLRPVTAAVAVAEQLDITPPEIIVGVGKIRAVPGRMNVLRGVEQALLIDDTYNSSPAAAVAALRTLYSLNVPARIAVLGDMNELGADSANEHTALGKMCDPNLLSWVITVGEQANKYTAPAAKQNGCQVASFATALQAGAYAHKVLEEHAAVLFKGSQNGIFLEEAVKMLLHTTDDEQNLVRQSEDWLEKKTAFFEQFEPEATDDD